MNVKKTKKLKENRPENYHVHDTNRLKTRSRALLDFSSSSPQQVTCLKLF